MSVHILKGTIASSQFDDRKVTLELQVKEDSLTLIKGARYPTDAAELLMPGKSVRLLLRKVLFDKVIHAVHDTTKDEVVALEEHHNPQTIEHVYLLGGWAFVVVVGALLTLTGLLAIVGVPVLLYALVIFPVQLLRDRRPLKDALSKFRIAKHEAPRYARKL